VKDRWGEEENFLRLRRRFVGEGLWSDVCIGDGGRGGGRHEEGRGREREEVWRKSGGKEGGGRELSSPLRRLQVEEAHRGQLRWSIQSGEVLGRSKKE